AKLGGISQTVAAFESLKIRGLDVIAVVLFSNEVYDNHLYLKEYFQGHGGIPVYTIPIPPECLQHETTDRSAMLDYYRQVSEGNVMAGILEFLDKHHTRRIHRLEAMSVAASRTIWHPFTQQKLLSSDRISTIDSAYGDDFQVLKPKSDVLVTVILVWHSLRPTLRASRKRYGWAAKDKIEILGLKGSYHGDTIGTMDCSEPSVFNEKVEWYQRKGFWFDFPSVWMRNGRWIIDIPESLGEHFCSSQDFDKLSDVFDMAVSEKQGTHEAYKMYFRQVLERLNRQGHKFGALMLEPIVLGAGGMILVDPLYQKALIDLVREWPRLFGTSGESSNTAEGPAWSGLPVILDEVFTGLYRLGRFTSSSFLNTHADISVHTKLLTGGLLPPSVTLASESVFDAFSSDHKSDALLHGHSYTAHAVGCQVALESLWELQNMEQRGDWSWAKEASMIGHNSTMKRKTDTPD
ncbi:hypothetical protein IL306_002460, partial [Fusarium sp. DS 682]